MSSSIDDALSLLIQLGTDKVHSVWGQNAFAKHQ